MFSIFQDNHPCVLTHFGLFKAAVEGKRLAVFLDYDGRISHKYVNRHTLKAHAERQHPLVSQAHLRLSCPTQTTRRCPKRQVHSTLPSLISLCSLSAVAGPGARPELGGGDPWCTVFPPHLSHWLQMREVVRAVARAFPTAIISGRGREKVEAFVQLKELFYAGSHGMDIAGPKVRQAS